jgi:four helix bundle protein
LVEAADSVGANIAEGSGRGTFKDNCHFARTARGSFLETRHFLRRAFRRKLLSEKQITQLQPLVSELGPRLNAYIRSLARRATNTKPRK